jgi:hypothetical protein
MAWHVLTLRMEEWATMWRVAANIWNTQSRTAGKGWSPALGFGKVLRAPHCTNVSLIIIHTESLGPGLILWYDLSNGKGTWDSVLGKLGACRDQFTYSSSQGISKIYIRFSGCTGG